MNHTKISGYLYNRKYCSYHEYLDPETSIKVSLSMTKLTSFYEQIV